MFLSAPCTALGERGRAGRIDADVRGPCCCRCSRRCGRATTPLFSHSGEPTLTVELGANGAGELRAGLVAVEPGMTLSRLQLRLSSDTPVLVGRSAAKQSSGTLRLLGTNASAAGEDFIGSCAEAALLWGITASDSLPGPQPQQLRTAARHYANKTAASYPLTQPLQLLGESYFPPRSCLLSHQLLGISWIFPIGTLAARG